MVRMYTGCQGNNALLTPILVTESKESYMLCVPPFLYDVCRWIQGLLFKLICITCPGMHTGVMYHLGHLWTPHGGLPEMKRLLLWGNPSVCGHYLCSGWQEESS